MESPSLSQTQVYSKLTDYLNKKLFNGELKECMYVFSRNKNLTGGYFSPQRWSNELGTEIPEIAINANVLADGDLPNMLQILVHEQVHFWQFLTGSPGRGGYHNQEWADKAKELGLLPVNVDNPDCETGDKISTSIIPGSLVEQVIAEILTTKADELVFPWSTKPLMVDDDGTPVPPPQRSEPDPPSKPQKSGKRTKYQCGVCGNKVWGKQSLYIICGDCSRRMVEEL